MFYTPCQQRVPQRHTDAVAPRGAGGLMIQYLLLQNRQGKTRLSKYYRAYTDDEKHKLEGEIHRLVTTRDPKFTNFVEARPHTPPRAPTAPAHRRRALSQYRQYKLIYRRYAGLFFTLCVVRPARPPAQATLMPLDEVGTAVPQDTTDNELMYFESIHLFVELL